MPDYFKGTVVRKIVIEIYILALGRKNLLFCHPDKKLALCEHEECAEPHKQHEKIPLQSLLIVDQIQNNSKALIFCTLDRLE
jgi:hypothetical protein